jgi:hypothetical protein
MAVRLSSRVVRRAIVAMLAGALVVGTTARTSVAQDPAGVKRELAQSPDFRVRLSAALFLGKTKSPGALEALVVALADPHPAVRTAAAAALGSLGDAAAIPALHKRLGEEPSQSVKAQIQTTIDGLRHSPGAISPSVKLVVQLGQMRNGASGRADLVKVLHDATRSRARALRGAVVADGDASVLQQAAEKHVPVLVIDGAVTQLTQQRGGGNVQVRAQVEYMLRKDQAIKGTISGAAITSDSERALSDQKRLAQLENDAVDGAVESALHGAEQGLMMAVK